MRKLLEFLFGKRHWLVFILCEIIAFTLLYRNNTYHRNVIFSSANTVVANFSSIYSYAVSYIKLRQDNKILFERNSQLEMEVLDLQRQIQLLQAGAMSFDSIAADAHPAEYSFLTAQVVSNYLSGYSNYITIDRGSADGVEADMGVVSTHGIVGIVSTVNEHFSVVIPLLNPKSRISCKLYNTNYYGSLSWDGRDVQYAILEELPLHSEFKRGDTIVTSGYSAVFPPGIIVGTVAEFGDSDKHNFYSLKIRLATDFRGLKVVRILKSAYQQERLIVEQEARKND